MNTISPKKARGKGAGYSAAITFWSVAIALTRSIGASQSAASAIAIPMLLGAVILAVHSIAIRRPLPQRISYRQGLRIALFVGYQYALAAALSLATSDASSIAVSLGNYLWPSLLLILSSQSTGLPLKFRLLPTTLGFAGTAMALFGADTSATSPDWIPFFVAAAGAVQWAIYSFLNTEEDSSTGWFLPLSMLTASVAAFVYQLMCTEQLLPDTLKAASEIMALGVFPTLGFLAWDWATKGTIDSRMASLTLTLPLLSSVISCAYLSVTPKMSFWIGATLVAIAILLSQKLGPKRDHR